MSLQRFTLLPQPRAKAQIPVEEVVAEPEGAPVEVVSVTRMAQGGAWRTEAMRSYDRPVLIWFTRGQGRLTISGRNCGYSPHNLVFLPAQTMHGFSTMGPVLGSVVFLPDVRTFDWPEEPLHMRLHDVRLQRELTGTIDAMVKEQDSGCALGHKALGHHAGLLSIWLSRTAEAHADAPNPSPGVRVDTAAHRLAEAYTSLIERDFRHAEGVQHYAALLGVTPTHLSRVCRKVAGRPALDILTDRRHFEARRLLRDTNMQIAQIARQSGFSSPAYFTRAFRARAGQSPSEFRESR
ncbi:MAG: AraC family transcriptional regulator [Silicimonas sp.]|nr:AraC family transcriptional regulator [Silicimonas sp.]